MKRVSLILLSFVLILSNIACTNHIFICYPSTEGTPSGQDEPSIEKPNDDDEPNTPPETETPDNPSTDEDPETPPQEEIVIPDVVDFKVQQQIFNPELSLGNNLSDPIEDVVDYSVILSWAKPDIDNISSYEIFMNDELVATILDSSQFEYVYKDIENKPTGIYSFKIVVNAEGKKSQGVCFELAYDRDIPRNPIYGAELTATRTDYNEIGQYSGVINYYHSRQTMIEAGIKYLYVERSTSGNAAVYYYLFPIDGVASGYSSQVPDTWDIFYTIKSVDKFGNISSGYSISFLSDGTIIHPE